MEFEIENGKLKKYHGDNEIIKIPDGVKEIGALAFCRCESAKEIIIPDSVSKIGDFAFSSCRLKSVVIPDSVTELGWEAFSECGILKSVVLGKNITKLGDSAFKQCYALDHLELPEGLEKVSCSAFEECYSLSTAWVNGIEYHLKDNNAPKPVKLVLKSILYGKQKIENYYKSGAMDEFEYMDYCAYGDDYSI